MKKALAVLATVATVGATMVSAPARARGIGPGLAFGLAAGALAAGAAGAYAYGPHYTGPAIIMARVTATTAIPATPIIGVRTTGTITTAIIGNGDQPGAHRSGLSQSRLMA